MQDFLYSSFQNEEEGAAQNDVAEKLQASASDDSDDEGSQVLPL